MLLNDPTSHSHIIRWFVLVRANSHHCLSDQYRAYQRRSEVWIHMEHVSAQWTTHTHRYLSLPCLQSKWGFDCYVSTDHSLKHGAAEEKTLPLPSLSPFPPFFSRPAQATRPHGRQPINYCAVSDSESQVLHIFYLQIITYYDNWGQNMDFIAQTHSLNHTGLSLSPAEKLL